MHDRPRLKSKCTKLTMTASVERGNSDTKIVTKHGIWSQQDTVIVVKHVHHFLIVTNMSTWQIVVQRQAGLQAGIRTHVWGRSNKPSKSQIGVWPATHVIPQYSADISSRRPKVARVLIAWRSRDRSVNRRWQELWKSVMRLRAGIRSLYGWCLKWWTLRSGSESFIYRGILIKIRMGLFDI